MDIKSDERHYYLKGLLHQLKADPFHFASYQQNDLLYHNYRLPGWERNEVKVLTRNEVVDKVIDYISELEAEVKNLQYVARIIKAAKEQ